MFIVGASYGHFKQKHITTRPTLTFISLSVLNGSYKTQLILMINSPPLPAVPK